MPDVLFHFEIKDWKTWSQVFCSIPEFTPLIGEILEIEGLPYAAPEGCYPGTNGVFKVGNLVVKIFAPAESEEDSLPDYRAELFAMKRADRLGVPVPRLMANGEIRDRYLFRYLIMECIDGELLRDVRHTLSVQQKREVGRQLRRIVQAWGTECENFNEADAIARGLRNKRWQNAPAGLLLARRETLEGLRREPRVFVHCDLTGDNLMLDRDGRLVVLDFADSILAPAIFEHMPVICDAFDFDRDFLSGYFGNTPDDEIAAVCTRAILCHEFGYWTLTELFGAVGSADDLYQRILEKLRAK